MPGPSTAADAVFLRLGPPPLSSAFSSFVIRPSDAKEWASEDGYYGMLASAFHGLVATAPVLPPVAAGPLIVDGACGVGAVKFP